MNILIWTVMAVFTSELVYGEHNPYEEALKARPWESIQDYVIVRPGAHMFYWLYYADGIKKGSHHKPLIIWLQGGPGYAASGLANFAEIGPLTMNMEPRNLTWVKGRNVLLFDHPVGAGFSFVRNITLLAKTDHEVATDLFIAIKEFMRIHKKFRNTPTYIFGQSYGGKICPILAYYLHKAVENETLDMNLKGIGIGGGFVNPKEYILMFPVFLYNLGLIDFDTYLTTTAFANIAGNCIDEQNYTEGIDTLADIHGYVDKEAGMLIYYSYIDQPEPDLDSLETMINTYVKPTLLDVVDQTINWVYLFDDVYRSLMDSFLVPTTNFVEMILNETKLKVAVYNGNMDVTTPAAGASNWVHKLKWIGSEQFKNAIRHEIRGTNNGYYKEARQLSFWCVFGAGHRVPSENPVAMAQILKHLISDNKIFNVTEHEH